MKLKNAAICLMIGSIYWIFVCIYSGFKAITKSWDYYKDNLVDLAIDRLFIIVPVSLLILSIALMKDKSNDVPANIPENKNASTVDDYQNLSVGEWLTNFLITLIPLVGLIFVIIWCNDDTNKVRKNWAMASLIWSAILFVLFIFLYTAAFNFVSRRY